MYSAGFSANRAGILVHQPRDQTSLMKNMLSSSFHHRIFFVKSAAADWAFVANYINPIHKT
jgi:hypothetical protein